MDNTSNARPYIFAIVVAVIIVGLIIVRTMPNKELGTTDTSSTTDMTASSTDMSDASTSPSATSPTVTAPVSTVTPVVPSTPSEPTIPAPTNSPKAAGLNFSTVTVKSTYTQNEQIPIGIRIDNVTDKDITMNFENGCQASYTVESFDSLAHTRCLPGATTLTVPAHGYKQLGVVHYPELYKITEGPTAFVVRVIGYGTVTVPFTITK